MVTLLPKFFSLNNRQPSLYSFCDLQKFLEEFISKLMKQLQYQYSLNPLRFCSYFSSKTTISDEMKKSLNNVSSSFRFNDYPYVSLFIDLFAIHFDIILFAFCNDCFVELIHHFNQRGTYVILLKFPDFNGKIRQSSNILQSANHCFFFQSEETFLNFFCSNNNLPFALSSSSLTPSTSNQNSKKKEIKLSKSDLFGLLTIPLSNIENDSQHSEEINEECSMHMKKITI